MSTVTRTTELEAVNTILSTIGESPVNSLTGTLPVDATTALNVLDEISREVQSAGGTLIPTINLIYPEMEIIKFLLVQTF